MYTFSFSSSELEPDTLVNLIDFRTGDAFGIDSPTRFSAIAPTQTISAGYDVDVFAISLLANRTYNFDIDTAIPDGTVIDLKLDIIDFKGNLVISDDDGGRLDEGSTTLLDPNLSFTPTESGIYFIAVRHWTNNYIDGAYSWLRNNQTTGDYSLNVSTGTLPPRIQLSDASQTRTFDGNDQRVYAGGGNDIIDLGGGRDFSNGQAGNDRISGGRGDDELGGGGGRDSLNGGDGNDIVMGGAGDDSLVGYAGNDHLLGGEGNDDLRGGANNDVIWGQNGNDVIRGNLGSDFLRGGVGIDTLIGGDGDDTFHFLRGEANAAFGTNVDTIADFSDGDKIDLTDLYSGTLSFIGSGAFTAANQVRLENFGGGMTKVQVNLDGSTNTSEVEILVNVSAIGNLAFGDFLLN